MSAKSQIHLVRHSVFPLSHFESVWITSELRAVLPEPGWAAGAAVHLWHQASHQRDAGLRPPRPPPAPGPSRPGRQGYPQPLPAPVLWIRIALKADPDSAFYLNAEPNHADPDSDPGPCQALKVTKSGSRSSILSECGFRSREPNKCGSGFGSRS